MIGASDTQAPSQPAAASTGLNALDRERAASLADEGGASAAAVESQDLRPPRARATSGWRIAAFALGVLAAWRVARPDRRRR